MPASRDERSAWLRDLPRALHCAPGTSVGRPTPVSARPRGPRHPDQLRPGWLAAFSRRLTSPSSERCSARTRSALIRCGRPSGGTGLLWEPVSALGDVRGSILPLVFGVWTGREYSEGDWRRKGVVWFDVRSPIYERIVSPIASCFIRFSSVSDRMGRWAVAHSPGLGMHVVTIRGVETHVGNEDRSHLCQME